MERPYLFYVGEEEVKMSLGECLKRVIVNRERTLPVIYKPQAMFRSATFLEFSRHSCLLILLKPFTASGVLCI